MKFPAKYKEQSDRFEITGVTKREPRPSRRAFSAQRTAQSGRAHTVPFSCEYRRDLRTLSSLETALDIASRLLPPHPPRKRVKFQVSVSKYRKIRRYRRDQR